MQKSVIFLKKSLKINMQKIKNVDPACFRNAPGLAWQVALLKKTRVKLDLLTDIDML